MAQISNQPRRVYQDLGNGMVTAVDQVFYPGSRTMQPRACGPQTTRQMTVQQAQASGFVVLPAMQGAAGNGTITSAENQYGTNTTTVRKEYMEGAGMVRTYQIGFTNGSGGDVTAYIGDANTIAYTANGGERLPGTVTISGTWGADSLGIWRLVTQNTPVKVNKIRINFDATSFLTSAQLITYKTRPDAIENTDNLNLSTWVSPDQFQSLIVENPTELRLVWDASLALAFLIPNGRTATLTLYYVSVADVHLMRRQ